jgi:putative aldouronate transport system permease protein
MDPNPPPRISVQRAPAGTKRSLVQQYVRHRALFFLLIPGLAYYVIFHYLPIYGLQIAFKEYFILRGIWGSPWVGLENFREIFSIGSFWEVLRNTVFISALNIVFGFPAPIILALLINEIPDGIFKRSTQTVTYLPHFVSWVILGGLFKQFLSPSMGPINQFIRSLGAEPIFFLGDPRYFVMTLVVTHIWKGIGWGSIIYLAALSGIDPGLYEAATIDGASRFQRVIHITIPSLTPVITIMLIFALRGIIIDDFDQIFNLYNPAVYSVGDVLSTYVYRKGLIELKYSFATAVGLFKNIVALAFILAANWIAKRTNDYGIW